MPRRAALLLTVLTALCSLGAGCAGHAVLAGTPPPLVMKAAPCPEPAAPLLARVDGEASFDGLDQYDAFMERDDAFRSYIKALRRALDCYRAQADSGQ